MTVDVLHDCGCVLPRGLLRVGGTAQCPTHGRCEALGVTLLEDALSRGLPAAWLDDGPRPSDARDADWDPERWETKD